MCPSVFVNCRRLIELGWTRLIATHLTLSGIDLRDCTFGVEDGLDELWIVNVTLLRSAHDDGDVESWWVPRGLRARRRVLAAEELAVRRAGKDASKPEAARRLPPVAAPSARDVAAIYQALRKGLEDRKDEPGAADFYYGEMEMRRRAAEPWSVERSILTLYWLVSGYGLRAWRAVAALVMVVVVAGWCGESPILSPPVLRVGLV